jgi:DNA polymerase-1
MRYFIGNEKLVKSDNYEVSSVEECLRYFEDKEYIEVDTETEGFDPHTKGLLCFQLGDPGRQYVIDSIAIDVQRFKELLERTDKVFLMQNAKFDLKFFMVQKIYITSVYDTMLAECLLTAGDDNREVSLKSLCKKYLDIDLDKTVRGSIHREGLSDRVIVYAADDVRYLTPIRDKQMIEINKWELNEVLDLENKAVIVFAAMEYHGVLIDTDKWMNVAEQAEANVISLYEELDLMVYEEPKLSKFVPKYIQTNLFGFEERAMTINWASPAQKLDIVNSLGIKLDSVADKELQKVKKDHALIPKLIDYSKQAKLSNAFGRDFLKFINKKTGRIHPTYWQILSTGRISVKEPNVNQIPARGELASKIREAFIPRPGYKMVGGDYSGMELRIIAEFSQDPLWVNAFKDGQDLHSVLCAATFGIDIKDVKKPFPEKPSLTYRDVQKTINFGLA